MNLLDIAYYFNQRAFCKDAVLLSTLPYCVISYDALSVLFNDPNERWHCLHRLQQQGMIEVNILHIQSNRRSYDYKYVSLTLDGLMYLADNYSVLYPWLAHLDIESICPRGNANADTFYRLLLRQKSNLFWSMTGAETIYQRMCTQPSAVASALNYHSYSRLWTPYVLAHLMQVYPTPANPIAEPTEMLYYDSTEARSMIAYCPVSSSAQNDNDSIKRDQSLFNSNHSGLLVSGSGQKYMGFTTSKHGIRWSSTPLVRNRKQLLSQFNVIKPGINNDIPGNGYHAFLICDSIHEMKHSFLNNRKQWAKRTHYLGQGVSSLYMLPYDSNGITLAQYILGTNHYNADLSYRLCKMTPEMEYHGLDLRTPIRYHGETCVPCFNMDAVNIKFAQQQVENNKKINAICWDWEVPYITSMVPEITIYAVASATGQVSKVLKA